MNRVLFILLITISSHCLAQITVDTTKTTVTIKEKAANTAKTMTIYRSFVEGRGMCNQIVYQPTIEEFGEEPVMPALNFNNELPHIKTMLDAANKRKQYNFSRFSINLLLYNDMMGKLVEIFTTSKEWNEYIKKAPLKRVTRLYDGTEVEELHYDARLAGWVLDRSDFLKDITALFVAYDYKVTSGGFADDHQQTVAPEMLAALGKSTGMVIPVPENFFVLTKVK